MCYGILSLEAANDYVDIFSILRHSSLLLHPLNKFTVLKIFWCRQSSKPIGY